MHTSNNINSISITNNEATYIQIAAYFRKQIATGKIHSGDRLPAIREVAKDLNLDPGTIARAYRELEQDGVITCRRGGGSYVSNNATKKHMAEQQMNHLTTLLGKAVTDALSLGASAEEIETVFSMQLAKLRERRDLPSNEAKKSFRKKSLELRFSGSHDLVVELLTSHLGVLYQDMRFTTSFVGSLSGLMALKRREADIAGTHLIDTDTGVYNIPYIKKLFPSETVILINLVQRMQGLMIAPGNPKHIVSILDLERPDITFVNRQKGSGTRVLLDAQLRKAGVKSASIKGYAREENTHVSIAAAVAQGQADAGLGAQSAAFNARLDFIPLLKERYDLAVLKENLANLGVQRAIKVIRQESFHNMVASIPGYDLTDTGKMSTVHSI
jgi:molybdate-binding protein/DNA-binding transcriptional regulator YhcF (GntR family)